MITSQVIIGEAYALNAPAIVSYDESNLNCCTPQSLSSSTPGDEGGNVGLHHMLCESDAP